LSHEIFPGLSYQKFYQLFALAGGSGVGLAMIFALLLNRKDSKGIKIAKIAFPFSIFNINGILIYGLPIVFNRYLLIPFLLIPLFDIAVAHWFLQWHNITFIPIKFAWTTPIFINGWMLSNGDLYVILFQACLLVVNTLMYIPFIKKYNNVTNKSYYIKELEKKLDITTSIQAREGLPVLKVQQDILDASHKVDNIVKLINKHSLTMHYQPKVDIHQYECTHYEALLRLKKEDGSLVGPYFLTDLENAGLAPVIDIWVCKEVKEDLDKWKENGYYPEISINLHPDTISDEKVIKQIIDILKGENIEFEILERSLIDNNKASTILNMLKTHGFKIAIDDFGVGYSSFELMTKFDIDTIKMDKSIIDLIDRPKGYAVCNHIIKLCNDINCRCVAEGVETQEQLDKLYNIGAKYVQGYYFSAAIAPNKLLDYTNSCKSKFNKN
jgi:EAL domain-containing protein (putative c-di-GMP-specific phosphodiesterase class I)